MEVYFENWPKRPKPDQIPWETKNNLRLDSREWEQQQTRKKKKKEL